VHAAGIDWSTGEFEWVRNSRVLVATLPPSPIPTKAKKTALYAPAAVRFSQPAPSSGGLLNVGKRVPKFEPPDTELQGQDKRSTTGAYHRLVVVQHPWVHESGASTNWASDFIRVVGPLAIVICQCAFWEELIVINTCAYRRSQIEFNVSALAPELILCCPPVKRYSARRFRSDGGHHPKVSAQACAPHVQCSKSSPR
jgi:hypothetical protein